jgi:TatD DNase family protein
MRPRLVDAHIHLVDPDYGELAPLLPDMIEGLGMVVLAVSIDTATSEATLKLAHGHPGHIVPFIGIHPAEVEEAPLKEFLAFYEQVKGSASGIGEVGLDPTYGGEEHYRLQRKVFHAHLELAERDQKPLSIHIRRVYDELLDILSTYRLQGVLLHWFQGEPRHLERAAELGYYFSFGPSLLYSKRMRRLASRAPRDRVLTETDGPVRFRGCFGGRVALPTFLPSVVYALAGLWGTSYDEVVRQVYHNLTAYLGFEP